MTRYRKEGIKWVPVEYFNNEVLCELIESHKNPAGQCPLVTAPRSYHVPASFHRVAHEPRGSVPLSYRAPPLPCLCELHRRTRTPRVGAPWQQLKFAFRRLAHDRVLVLGV